MRAVYKLLRSVACATLALSLLSASEARADAGSTDPATFAITIGVNRPVDADLPTLRFADDDAARNYDMMAAFGVPTWVVARPDDNTARLHPAAAHLARPATLSALRGSVREVTAQVRAAKARGRKTVVYIFYAGHGGVKNGEGYVTLEDARLSGSDLVRELTAPIDADQYHVVLDACSAHAVAFGRGPGGSRRSADRLQELARLKDDPRVGLLLATTTAAETHEWDALSAGVFSHEIRSGLMGAADADGDGRITYRELVSFVRQANEDVPNERFRPAVTARPPSDSETFYDTSRVPLGRVVIDGPAAGRYIVEDSRGVRLADIHTAPDRRTTLLRTSRAGFFLRSPSGDRERFVPFGSEPIALRDVPPASAEAHSRGAAHESFARLFAHPFNPARVADTPYELPPIAGLVNLDRPESTASSRKTAGVVTVGAGAALLVTGGVLLYAASRARADAPDTAAQVAISSTNARISTLNTLGTVSLIAGGVAAASGVTLVLWPVASPKPTDEGLAGAGFAVGGAF